MKKLLVVLAILTLVCGSAYAIDKDQAITNEYAARNVGRSVATDSTVALKVWCKNGVLPYCGVGVSSSTSIILYKTYAYGTQEGYTITLGSTYVLGSLTDVIDTPGELVSYINGAFASDSSVQLVASLGNDVHKDTPLTAIATANITACGVTQDATESVVKRQTNDRISVGAEAKSGAVNRIKSMTAHLDLRPNAPSSGGVTLRIYDGTTVIWRKYVTQAAWNAEAASYSSNNSSSSNTVEFPDCKGISSSVGNGLVAECVVDTQQPNHTAAELAGTNIAIIYDQLKQ